MARYRLGRRSAAPGGWGATIARTPLLSAEEERDLIRRAQAGDTSARDRLVECNLRLVLRVIGGMLPSGSAGDLGLSADDLAQEGATGLMRAIEKFDLSRGTRLTTYAVHWIRQAASRAATERGLVIHLPQHVDRSTAPSVRASLDTETMQPDVRRALRHDATQSETAEAASARADILRYVWRLPRRLALVIRLRYGLDDDDPQTCAAIGRRLSLSRERVRQLEGEALAKLRRWMALDADRSRP